MRRLDQRRWPTITYTYGAQGAQNNSAGRVTNIAYGSLISISEGYQYTAPGQVSRKSLSVDGASSLNVSYTYDSEGRTLTITYPYNPPNQRSPQYTYGYDAMGRLNTMTETDGGNYQIETGTTYNAANQILAIAGSLSESRNYNANGQMTNLTSGSFHYAYNYSATQNNGRIASMQNVASGETITYAYDSLNRLIGASGTGDPQGSWSQTFSYDGFGNLLSKIGNNAPNLIDSTPRKGTNTTISFQGKLEDLQLEWLKSGTGKVQIRFLTGSRLAALIGTELTRWCGAE